MTSALKLLVVVIQEDKELSSLLSDFLVSSGYRVITFADPVHFLKEFSHKLSELAAVVTDVHVPKMNGFDFTHSVKNIRQDLPVVMISSLPQSSFVVHPEKQKAEVFLHKPFQLSHFLKSLQDLIFHKPTPVELPAESKQNKSVGS